MSSQPRFIRAARVPDLYAISRRTLARWEKADPNFPKVRRLSSRLLVLKVDELERYFEQRNQATTQETADV